MKKIRTFYPIILLIALTIMFLGIKESKTLKELLSLQQNSLLKECTVTINDWKRNVLTTKRVAINENQMKQLLNMITEYSFTKDSSLSNETSDDQYFIIDFELELDSNSKTRVTISKNGLLRVDGTEYRITTNKEEWIQTVVDLYNYLKIEVLS